MERKMIRPGEIAKALGVSKRTVHRMLDDGRLLKLKISERCVGTTPQSLKELLERAEFQGLEE